MVSEKLDVTGMVVTVTYTNGDTAILTSYTMNPSITQSLSKEDTNIIITYIEEGITKVATQPIEVSGTTLGELIGNDATYYGKIVDYSAGLIGNEVTAWKVFYKQTIAGEDYVYLITTNKLTTAQTPTIVGTTKTANSYGDVFYWNTVPSDISEYDLSIAQTYFMANWQSENTSLIGNAKYSTNNNAKCVAQLLNISFWSSFANADTYGEEYIIGAIGSPTVEMWVASWHQNGGSSLVLSESGIIGYNLTYEGVLSTANKLYFPGSGDGWYNYWVASPSASSTTRIMSEYGGGYVTNYTYDNADRGIRPVVCLKADIAAYWEDEDLKTVIKFGVREN